MNQGFIRVAAATPKIKVADPEYNAGEILKLMSQGAADHTKVMVFPELSIRL